MPKSKHICNINLSDSETAGGVLVRLQRGELRRERRWEISSLPPPDEPLSPSADFSACCPSQACTTPSPSTPSHLSPPICCLLPGPPLSSKVRGTMPQAAGFAKSPKAGGGTSSRRTGEQGRPRESVQRTLTYSALLRGRMPQGRTQLFGQRKQEGQLLFSDCLVLHGEEIDAGRRQGKEGKDAAMIRRLTRKFGF